MLDMKIMDVCCKGCTKHTTTLTVQNSKVVMLHLVVHPLTTEVETVKNCLLEI
jgi:hypothetical protein